ncbi:MAG TPA: translocation/assembly module TamB domain-containing protein, partial [Bacteroidales bacterium]|nr:translocation/assembly module TamB domain-containing protein [Bacteroidales bacterium]HPS72190.1 translocation/assembly module TamB domain-containing protein [Bacteroidales bacterium]
LPGTTVGFPISYASTSYEDRGIRFVAPIESPTQDKPKITESNFEMDFDFVFDVNKDADVRIDLEPVDGVLDCKTNGKIRLTYNSKSDALNMDGRLDLLTGNFSMSLKNLLPRKFELMEGGSINFVGPIKSSTISLTALYPRTVSLKTLSEEIDLNKTQVNAYLTLSGDLMNPQPSFSFGFPKLTSEEEKQVFSVLDTTDSQNNLLQFFSLVYLGTFYSTVATLTDVQPVDASMQLMASTFSNMILQEIKFVDMNVNVLSANQYFKEYSVDFQKPFYNNRILVKSRFGYAESLTEQADNSNFIGDVSFEYLINEEGNWRLRLFYFNDQTILNNYYQNMSRPTQGGGVGLIYKQEFFGRRGLEELTKDRRSNLDQSNK